MNLISRLVQTALVACCLSILALFWAGDARAATNQTATAVIYSTSNPSERLGAATFSPTEGGLHISVVLDNAASGERGFHIHEVGSCEDGGMAAKGHFNPNNTKHGYLLQDGIENAHAGDLGNITIAPDGTGTLNLTLADLSLDDGKYAVRGHSVILHEKSDDPTAQPTGNAGGRIGCGIID
ncbi:superoxide dismutase family protein [Oscillatoria sp. FACHB-1406]|uniref:superoxide dismutase family protein n=1 Tax=Oscillatoria sp. FACHB-1406 TaxID=2692846 RepID=UPI001685D00F|nr:superoxide dismutase family protein [Oscillatoria sp. FACHB-1406]MBD2579813.1 superoxide dismutase family protein [Oscillatoria sp. FACHB-1406]